MHWMTSARRRSLLTPTNPFSAAPCWTRVIQRYAETLAPIVVPLYGDKRGSPVLLTRSAV